jgi:hypothetical protein
MFILSSIPYLFHAAILRSGENLELHMLTLLCSISLAF